MKPYKKLFEQVLSVPVEINLNNPSDQEILRIAISSEQGAINLYTQLAKYVKDKKLGDVLLEIAQEEKVHIGEFQTLLNDLDVEEVDAQKQGKKEVNKI